MSWNWFSSTSFQMPVQFLVGVVDEPAGGGRGAPQLGLAQQVFAAAVALLGQRLGGVGAAVQLKVELALPYGGVGVFGLGRREELRRGSGW